MVKLEKLLIATRNPAKYNWFKNLFRDRATDIIDLQTLAIDEKPNESGETAEQNSSIKARFYVTLAKIPTFSEDESLFVDFLSESEQPGVHVRRVNRQDEVDDEKLLTYWEKIIAKVPVEKRTGHWHIAYCLAASEKKFKVVTKDFPIVFFSPSSRIRVPGWPMSSLQGAARFGKPHTEMSAEEHRIINMDRDEQLLSALDELLKV